VWRIVDLDDVREQLPEIRYGVAYGRMGASELEDVIAAFDERAFDLLLSTNVIEAGLDVPSTNTLIVHRSDMFGLAQLTQELAKIARNATLEATGTLAKRIPSAAKSGGGKRCVKWVGSFVLRVAFKWRALF
jgi:RecG-like helicase